MASSYDNSSTRGSSGGDVARDETHELISASKVNGTAVYDSSGEKVGSVDDVMLEKRTGKVSYAIMSFGGFLGIGERYHPLPWDVLSYDEKLGGYNVGRAAGELRDAPSYSRDELSSRGSKRFDDVDDYYAGSARTGYGSGGMMA
jgi:sporulation protein YlmC with PRC-barrel domain